jgi:hypothetical protein
MRWLTAAGTFPQTNNLRERLSVRLFAWRLHGVQCSKIWVCQSVSQLVCSRKFGFLAGVGYDALRLERTVARQRRRASVNLECSIFTWLTAPGPPPSSPRHLLVGQAIWNHGSSPRADGFHEANVTTAGERMQGLHRKLPSYRAQHSTNSTLSSVRPFHRCSLESIVGLESTRYHGSALLSRLQVGPVSLGRSATQVAATTWHAWLPIIENSEPTVLSPGTLPTANFPSWTPRGIQNSNTAAALRRHSHHAMSRPRLSSLGLPSHFPGCLLATAKLVLLTRCRIPPYLSPTPDRDKHSLFGALRLFDLVSGSLPMAVPGDTGSSAKGPHPHHASPREVRLASPSMLLNWS